MNDVSFAFALSYGANGPKQKYLPAIKELGDSLCACYGISFPMKYEYSDEPLKKMHLTRVSTLLARYLVRPFGKVFNYPDYYTYWCNMRVFDALYSRKITKDKSKIVFTSPLLVKTVQRAKKAGKIVVIEAGNSEPKREHTRVKNDYEEFGINHRFIYGDPNYSKTCFETIELADYVISLSKVSLATYIDAGYPSNKFKLISMAGTDFEKQPINSNIGKKKAFISTAFHNFVKGTHRLLLAWKQAKIKDIPLIIVGRLSEDLQEFIEKYGPFENVIFTGTRTDIREWYKQFDAVGILLSLSEGAVRVTPEMMSFGFPMITSADASCDLVVNGENGYIVDPFDIEALSELLCSIDKDWNQIRPLSENAIRSVNNRTLYDYSIELGAFLKSLI